MKEKERKRLELLAFAEETKLLQAILEPPKKNIKYLLLYHNHLRQAFFSEIVESLFDEYNKLLLKLERYGENSPFWEKDKIGEREISSPESKRPSKAWLRWKVKCYEYETT